MDFAGKNITVVGLARTGAAVARFLAKQGAHVTVTDMRPAADLQEYVRTLPASVVLVLGSHPDLLFTDADLIVVSPGVPMDIRPLRLAREAGTRIISEVELAARNITAPILAITGTNGKTTTTTLCGEILKSCGFSTFVGGNIGNPLIELAETGEQVDRVVAELSSFQLEAIETFRPGVAVLLNVTEDHLDRYASFADYIAAKEEIFRNQTKDDFAIMNVDDAIVAEMAQRISATVVPMSRLRQLREGVFYRSGEIVFRFGGREELLPLEQVSLKGAHNIENMMAAFAASLLMGADAQRARQAVEQFRGLRHRVELVRELNGVGWYDDSKGTNVGSVVKALEGFERPVTLIAGGKDKGGDYAPLEEQVRGKVAHLILIGEAKERINAALGSLTDTHLAASMEEAVSLAHGLTKEGAVLLSPACSSFDMFRSYSERGDRFAALVRDLPEEPC